jgi:FKBP-type peptidyl-prolyl cis-trans isomerase SlyD
MTKQIMGFHYTLKDINGQVIDSSEGAAPLLFMLGSGHIIPGLETSISAMEVGEKKNVEVKAKDAYGEVIEDLKMVVERQQFPPEADLQVGDQFRTSEDPNAPVFTITVIEDNSIHIDGNHPLAGKDLFFDIEVTEKRDATEEEMAHGHAHGPGGHHH